MVSINGYGLIDHYAVEWPMEYPCVWKEKTMSKIDWHKPIRAMDGTAAKPYNSHGTRVVWIGDYVYPVDENGRATASVYYPKATGRSCSVGERLVENVPEELYLRLCNSGGQWRLDGAGSGPYWGAYEEKNALPLQMWKDYYGAALESDRCILVKVPV